MRLPAGAVRVAIAALKRSRWSSDRLPECQVGCKSREQAAIQPLQAPCGPRRWWTGGDMCLLLDESAVTL